MCVLVGNIHPYVLTCYGNLTPFVTHINTQCPHPHLYPFSGSFCWFTFLSLSSSSSFPLSTYFCFGLFSCLFVHPSISQSVCLSVCTSSNCSMSFRLFQFSHFFNCPYCFTGWRGFEETKGVNISKLYNLEISNIIKLEFKI